LNSILNVLSHSIELVVLTSAESELGQKTTQELLATGEYHVIGGVRNLDSFADSTSEDFTPFTCDLESFDSVDSFCDQVQDFCLGKPLDRLICYAGDSSSSQTLQWTKDEHERNMQVNFLSPFLMTGRFLRAMEDSFDARLTFVCPTEAKNAKIANLVDLEGFEAGFTNIPMVDGTKEFNGEKAVEDAKLCQKLLSNFLHEKYHKLNHVTFNDISIQDTTSNGLFQIIHGPKAGSSKSGASWKSQSSTVVDCSTEDDAKCYDIDMAYRLFHLSEQVTQVEWPQIKVVTSPCPTLKVVGAVTKAQVQKQELKRMRELGRPGISEPEVVERVTKRQKIAAVADKVAGFVFKNTVKRVAKVASSQVLGEFPEEATNNYIEAVSEEDRIELESEIFSQISEEKATKKVKDGKSKYCLLNKRHISSRLYMLTVYFLLFSP
jgi:NAD(P)-dependent dehydrogenase (short-subunit alcohol dehydrogenase family)